MTNNVKASILLALEYPVGQTDDPTGYPSTVNHLANKLGVLPYDVWNALEGPHGLYASGHVYNDAVRPELWTLTAHGLNTARTLRAALEAV